MGRKVASQLRETAFYAEWMTNGHDGPAACRAVGHAGTAASLSTQASKYLKSPKIQMLIKAVQAQTELAAERHEIADELERKRILTEIARASLSDYVLAGPDGDEVSITKDSPNPHALAEVQTRTDYDQDGSKPRVIQRVKLRDPVGAIDLLNKMDKLYSDGAGQAQTTPNQTFIFNLDGRSVSARELYQRAIAAANSVPMVQDGTCTDAPEG